MGGSGLRAPRGASFVAGGGVGLVAGVASLVAIVRGETLGAHRLILGTGDCGSGCGVCFGCGVVGPASGVVCVVAAARVGGRAVLCVCLGWNDLGALRG